MTRRISSRSLQPCFHVQHLFLEQEVMIMISLLEGGRPAIEFNLEDEYFRELVRLNVVRIVPDSLVPLVVFDLERYLELSK
jgi:hypothetical protein